MRTSIYNYKLLIALMLFIGIMPVVAQTDSLLKRTPTDSSGNKLNMDAVYNRPFLTAGKLPIAIGGYLEANTHYSSTDGTSEGLSFQMRRLTLFLSSAIAKKIKFLSEIEFEDGTKEINLEFCAIDIELHPLFNVRGGVIMNPIGGFNQNHDGPRWDFIERPLSATGIIPSTLSNAGMGAHGKYFSRNIIIGYEFYLTNGFDNKVIDNAQGRTSLAAGKVNIEKFEESNSGSPMYTGKIALRNRKIGELGMSYMSGIYNKWQEDGLQIDRKRSVTVMALDFNTSLLKNKLSITGEYARVMVDVPNSYTQQYGEKQWGTYMDVIYTVLQKKMFGWEKAKLNIGLRGEMVDYNVGTIKESGTTIGDDVWAIVPTIAFRPSGTTVIRFNYRFESAHDFLNNAPSKTGVIQFGFSSYF